MKPVLVINVVGLTQRQVGARTPHLAALAGRGAMAPMRTVLPALTLSSQATMLTGELPSEHGIVGNGWFFRDQGEVWLWRQTNPLVQGEMVYEHAQRLDPNFTCAKLFWWWSMGADAKWTLLPKPFYPADGSKLMAIYGTPRGFEDEVEARIGKFPFFDFWGPKAGLPSSRWLTDAALYTMDQHQPSLTLVYLPHLDYSHQRLGPKAAESLAALGAVDALVGELVAKADALGMESVVVSEYGIEEVDTPIHINQALRAAGLLAVRETPVGETLDTSESRAFAVSDHQIAHVYVRCAEDLPAVREVLSQLKSIEHILEQEGKAQHGIDHERAGEFVCVAQKGAWFTYYYWLDESKAPDFARTVDIHRKPGYDPCELFVDPKLKFPMLRVARRLLQKKLGMRYLMDVIPIDASLVKGSHGRVPEDPADGPVFIASQPFGACGPAPSEPGQPIESTSIPERLLALLQR
jgi:predicted AlkP superfamily pyrophosphatase or phosphodiesterase